MYQQQCNASAITRIKYLTIVLFFNYLCINYIKYVLESCNKFLTALVDMKRLVND